MDPVVLLSSWPDGAAGDIWRTIPLMFIVAIILLILRMALEWFPS